MPALNSIRAEDLHKIDTARVCILDVRTGPEYAENRLAQPTAFAPVGELDPADMALRHGIVRDTPIYTLCASGNRAKLAATKLMDAGFTHVTVIDGGLAACKEAGIPTTGAGSNRTAGTSLNLDRQVRIAAGGLVMLFLLLGIWGHPIFLLPAFLVGAGQVFSGITNWCGMGLLLAKAPWNKNTACAISKKPNPGASCQ